MGAGHRNEIFQRRVFLCFSNWSPPTPAARSTPLRDRNSFILLPPLCRPPPHRGIVYDTIRLIISCLYAVIDRVANCHAVFQQQNLRFRGRVPPVTLPSRPPSSCIPFSLSFPPSFFPSFLLPSSLFFPFSFPSLLFYQPLRFGPAKLVPPDSRSNTRIFIFGPSVPRGRSHDRGAFVASWKCLIFRTQWSSRDYAEDHSLRLVLCPPTQPIREFAGRLFRVVIVRFKWREEFSFRIISPRVRSFLRNLCEIQ